MKALAIITLCCITSVASAQHQIILLKKGNVVRRFHVDDFIRYSLNGRRDFVRDRIVEFTDTSFITTRDTVSLYKVKFIDIGREETSGITVRKLGAYFIAAGVILPLGDFVNIRLIQDRHYDLDDGLITTSAVLITTGALCMIFDKRYRRTGIIYRLKMVDYSSPLYKSDRPVKKSNLIPGN